MKQKTARFNYLENKQADTEGKMDSERYQYRHIINKLTKEHQYQNVLKDYYKEQLSKQKRDTSPFIKTSNINEERKNSQIKSIILNENINLSRKKTPKNQNATEPRDAYRMIKESHIMKDDQFQKIQENDKSPTNAYDSPLKEMKIPQQHKYSYNPIKFYQIKLEHTPSKKKMNVHKNNEPYVNQLYGVDQSNGGKYAINPQIRQSPSRLGMTGDPQIGRNNRTYKGQRSQQKPYDINKHRYNDERRDIKKRSCFDYVPKQLKQKLARARQHQY